MSETDIQKIAVYDDRIIQERPAFAVKQGALSLTNAPFRAISQSTAHVQRKCTLSSLNVFVNRDVDLTSTFYVKGDLTFNTAPANGVSVLNLGKDTAVPAFPLHSLCNTVTCTINDATTTLNVNDVIYEMLRLTDFEKNRKQRTCPTMLDKYGNYEDGKGAINDVLSGYQDATDFDNVPNGAYFAVHEVDNAGVVLATPTAGDGSETDFTLYFRITSTEKIMLSPFVFSDLHENDTGLFGVQNMNFVMNIGTGSRILRTNREDCTMTAALYTPQNKSSAFENSQLDVQFLTPSLSVPLPPRSIVPYWEFPRYLSSHNLSGFTSGAKTNIISNTIVLPCIPDLFLIYAKPRVSDLTTNDADFYFPVEHISLQFDNFAGVLSSHNVHQLYSMSFQNGLEIDYNSWRGQAKTAESKNTNTQLVGGFLCLRPGTDITLQEGQAPGLLGSYSFQCNITIRNTSSRTFQNANLFIVAVNSGFFETQNGSSRILKSVLSEADVLSAKTGGTTTGNLQRMVGSGLGKHLGSRLMTMIRNHRPIVSSVKTALQNSNSKVANKVGDFLETKGFGQCGAGVTGAGKTGAGKEKKKDQKKAILSRLM